jgi:hypothetical protein
MTDTRYAAPGEVESCLRRSLALNAGLYDSADLLSCDLVDRDRCAEAAQVVRDIERRMPDPSPARGRQAWIRRRQGEREEAVRDMTATVTAAPWFGWGWDVLMGWLEEDKAWDIARRLLKEVPAQMSTNTAFRGRRLVLLGKAGVERILLDAEWDELLRNFPDDASLDAARSESARDAEATESANASSSDPVMPWWLWGALAMAGLQLARSCS